MTTNATTIAYLDHAASSPLVPAAREAMARVMDMTGNPSSVHGPGRALRAEIELARDAVAQLAGALRSRVVFTGSATEALTQAICGVARAGLAQRIVVSAGEHMAVLRAAEASGLPVTTVGLMPDGVVDLRGILDALDRADAAGETALVAIHQVNNETGVVAAVESLGEMIGDRPHILVVDAAQSFGKLPVLFQTGRADMVALSAHKIGGPAGVGALLVKPRFDEVRLIPGGGQEQGRRGGTESAMLIAGFGAAASVATEVQDRARFKVLSTKAEETIRRVWPGAVIFGEKAERLENIENFALPGLANATAMIGFDLEGVCLSAGSACSSGKIGKSHVLAAMGVDEGLAGSALRLSVGWNTTEDDIERFGAALETLAARHRNKNAA